MDNKAALAQAAGRSPFFVMRCMEVGKWYSLEALRNIISAFCTWIDDKNRRNRRARRCWETDANHVPQEEGGD